MRACAGHGESERAPAFYLLPQANCLRATRKKALRVSTLEINKIQEANTEEEKILNPVSKVLAHIGKGGNYRQNTLESRRVPSS